jgi:hypothetical protein
VAERRLEHQDRTGESVIAEKSLIKKWRLLGVGMTLTLSGCVIGGGPCLWLAPVKHEFSGHVHFRDFPNADGIDNVPVLVLDKTSYIYTPNHSHQCLAANDVQLVGVSEFPQNVGENSHVNIRGSVFEAGSANQHTRFLINVLTIAPVGP